MGFQAVPDVAEVDVIYSYNAKIVQNTFYGLMVGGYALSDLQALADEVSLRVNGNFLAQQPPEAIYLRTEVKGLAFINDQVATSVIGNGPGIHTGSALPNNVTFSIKKTSGQTGRSARGRAYWIGIPANELVLANENLLEAAYVVLLVAAVEQIRQAINFVGIWQAVLVSRITLGVQRPTGITFPWVGVENVDTQIDTNRGRMP